MNSHSEFNNEQKIKTESHEDSVSILKIFI